MKKILLIEDDLRLAEMYKEQFELSGLRVALAKDSDEAFKKISPGINLILLDILLPGENGFEILKKIKNHKDYKKIPVVILTNLGTEKANKDTDLAISLGASKFLVKAYYTPDQIVKKIKSMVTK